MIIQKQDILEGMIHSGIWRKMQRLLKVKESKREYSRLKHDDVNRYNEVNHE